MGIREIRIIRASLLLSLLTAVILALSITPSWGRAAPWKRDERPQAALADPAYGTAAHNLGRLVLGVSNTGRFGFGTYNDVFTGEVVPGCEFPKGSETTYLYGAALWVGAVIGGDTLVSVGLDGWSAGGEFIPDVAPFGVMQHRSTIDPRKPEFEGAISEQDFIAVYYDTMTGGWPDYLDQRPHMPLNLEVTQRSFAWSYSYAQDFVLFDYSIRNIGEDRLRRIYIGIYVDADIYTLAEGNNGAQDDLCGFREKQPALYLGDNCAPDSDVVNIAWTADNNGDYDKNTGTVRNVTATRIIRTPSDSLEVSFNWWISNGNASLDFGPQAIRSTRDFRTGGTGTPEGDRNKYHILSNGEFDYDQPRVATITAYDSIWRHPPQENVQTWATGLDTRYVLSFGPFQIDPGQSLPITLAYVGGVDFHQNLQNFDYLPHNPDDWYKGVNFDSLGTSATWAEWVYDNPGVDTDSDGYAGEFTTCYIAGDSTLMFDTTFDSSSDPITFEIEAYWSYEVADTVWRKGDGIPDFRGASPPPAPSAYTILSESGEYIRGLRVAPKAGTIRLLWNGALSENTRDVFSRRIDFEGYRVWIARDDRPSSYAQAASYDLEDYNRHDFNPKTGRWGIKEFPFSLLELRVMYGESPTDSNWHPDMYPNRIKPLVVPASAESDLFMCYFTHQDRNQSTLGNHPGVHSGIFKRFPDAPRPPTHDPDSVRVRYADQPDSLDRYLTEEGFLKYFEYEFIFTDLLPTIPYWLNVTVFDFGSPRSGLPALETNPSNLPIATYPMPLTTDDPDQALEIFAYPNPYRADGNYRRRGYEGRGEAGRMRDRVRIIHFANLPARCTIRIFSLDGDLIREIVHDGDPANPLANHDTWDLITRNSQLVVSGLYYWTAEDASGKTQIGKLVIIM